MAVFNLCMRNILQTVSNTATVTINHQQQVAECRMVASMSVAFFTRGLHTCTAVAHLPLHQLGFLVFLLQRETGVSDYVVCTHLVETCRLLQVLNECLWITTVFRMGGENLGVAQNTYAVSWFHGRELNMVFGLQLSFSRVVHNFCFVFFSEFIIAVTFKCVRIYLRLEFTLGLFCIC